MRIYRSCKVISAIVLGAALLATGCAAPASPTPSTPPPQSSRSSSTPSGQSKPPDQFSATPTSSSSQPSTPKTSAPKVTSWSTPPAMSIDQNKQYTATIKTNYGDMVVQLFPKEAPLTVNNFVFLSRQGFYDGVKFHRIVKNFVIQGGDPTGTGGGGPGYKFADEKVTRDYLKGSLAMANSGANTNGSQFFICLADLIGRLPKNYNLFGIVTGGMDVLDKIGNLPVAYNPNMGETSAPTVDVHINTIVIDEK